MGSGLPTYCPLTKWYQASYSHRRPLEDLQTSGILQHSSSIFWCFHFCWCQWFAKMAESVTCDRAKIGQWNRPTRLQRRWQVLVSRAKTSRIWYGGEDFRQREKPIELEESKSLHPDFFSGWIDANPFKSWKRLQEILIPQCEPRNLRKCQKDRAVHRLQHI